MVSGYEVQHAETSEPEPLTAEAIAPMASVEDAGASV